MDSRTRIPAIMVPTMPQIRIGLEDRNKRLRVVMKMTKRVRRGPSSPAVTIRRIPQPEENDLPSEYLLIESTIQKTRNRTNNGARKAAVPESAVLIFLKPGGG